uniref:Uncharacterized protein n=1 Tax=Hippocampus comes TaxID=109280 RepID=A0A3Q3DAZ6_HIPCM
LASISRTKTTGIRNPICKSPYSVLVDVERNVPASLQLGLDAKCAEEPSQRHGNLSEKHPLIEARSLLAKVETFNQGAAIVRRRGRIEPPRPFEGNDSKAPQPRGEATASQNICQANGTPSPHDGRRATSPLAVDVKQTHVDLLK